MIAINKDISVCFIDYYEAFDRVFHQKIIEILKYTEMDRKDIRIIQNLYWEQKQWCISRLGTRKNLT